MLRRSLCLATVVAVVALSGCASVEQHITVRSEAETDLGFALRLPAMAGMMLGQMLDRAQGTLPPGLEVGTRTEDGDFVLDAKVPAELLPPQMGGLFRVSTRPKLLTTLYRLRVDPMAMNPRELLRLGQAAPGALRPGSVLPAGLSLGGAARLSPQTQPDLQGMLDQLGGLFGGQVPNVQGLDIDQILGQVELATYVHMPGRVVRTNGTQVDEDTVKWLMEPKKLSEIGTPSPLTVESEGVGPRLEALAGRLSEERNANIAPERLLDAVARGLLPNRALEPDEAEPVVDTALYGALVSLVAGLDVAVGRENTGAVMEKLGLTEPEPSLAAAAKAAARLPLLRERGEVDADLAASLLGGGN